MLVPGDNEVSLDPHGTFEDSIIRLISQDMMEVINRLGLDFAPIPFSIRTSLGFNRLYSEISRVFMGGEPFTT